MSQDPTGPDPMELDALLRGDQVADTDALWANVVESPSGAGAWADARKRHAALERTAHLTLGRPWLASSLLRLRRLGRAIKAAPKQGVTLSLPDLSPALQTLAPAPAPTRRELTLVWGRTQQESVQVGSDVLISGPPGCTLLWQSGQGGGPLSNGLWRMGDEPVLLLAVQGEHTTLEQALASGDPVASVVLQPEG